MLEKNKDYVEFTLQCTTVERTRDKDYRQVCFNGYSDFDFSGAPMDVVCKEFDHKVVMVSKRAFERLQARADSNAELARQWEINYDLLLKKTGFDTVEELVFYLTNVVQCDTLREAISKSRDQAKYTCDEWKDMKKKLEECEKDYISERDKAEALEKENKELKNKLHEFDPIPEFKELTEKLQSTEDVEELEWVLNHTCESWGSVNGWRSIAQFWKGRYEDLSKLRNEGTHIVYLNDPIGIIARWERVTGYDRPEDFLKWKTNIEGIMEAWRSGTGCKYPAEARILLEKWKVLTKCETPEAAATWITSYESACENLEAKLKEIITSWEDATGYSCPEDFLRGDEKLADDVKSWQNVTGYSTPESFLAGMINNIYRSNPAWQKATGCKTPEEAETTLRNLRGRIDEIKEFAAIASNWTDRIVED